MSRHFAVALISCILFPLVPAAHAAESPVPTDIFADFGAYTVIPNELAGAPNRAKELGFVKDCRNRLTRSVDRGVTSGELIKRFQAEFDADKTAVPTRLAVALLVAHLGESMSGGKGDYAADLIAGIKDTGGEADTALYYYARTRLARYRGCGRHSENEHVMKRFTREYLADKLDASAFGGNEKLQSLLYSLYTEKPCNPFAVRQNLAEDKAFAEMLEKIPDDKKSFAVRLALGNHYVLEAWRLRGSGWATDTTDDQWKGFEEALPIAALHFRKALELKPRDERAIDGLMVISMASPKAAGGDTAHWLSLVSGDPSANLMESFAYANSERWGGSPISLFLAYKSCLASNNYDSPKPGIASDLIRYVIMDANEPDRTALLKRRALDFIPVANEYIRRFNESGRALIGPHGNAYDYRARALACLTDADLLSEAPKLLRYSKPGFGEDSLDSVDEHRITDNSFTFPHAMACEESHDFSLIESGYPSARTLGSMRNTDNDDARMALHTDPAWLSEFATKLTAMKAKTSSAVAKTYVDEIIALNRSEQDFVAYKQVSLPMSRELWDVNAWRGGFASDGITADRRILPHIAHYATYKGVFAPPYELSIKIKSEPLVHWPHVGFTIGRAISGSTGRSFMVEADTGKTYVMAPVAPASGDKNMLSGANKKVGKDVLLRVRIFAHGYAIAIDDGKWLERRDNTFVPLNISIGSLPGYPAYGHFEYSAFSIHRLKKEELSEKEAGFMSGALVKKQTGDTVVLPGERI